MVERWYRRIRTAIESLQHHPERCPQAPEDEWYDGTLRQLLHGKRAQVYRILFKIRSGTVEGALRFLASVFSASNSARNTIARWFDRDRSSPSM